MFRFLIYLFYLHFISFIIIIIIIASQPKLDPGTSSKVDVIASNTYFWLCAYFRFLIILILILILIIIVAIFMFTIIITIKRTFFIIDIIVILI